MNDLYRTLILDHNRYPRCYGTLESRTHYSEGFNPLCGDHYHVELEIKDDCIAKIRFSGEGCAISKASGSFMAYHFQGKPVSDVELKVNAFAKLIKMEPLDDEEKELVKPFLPFENVGQYPARVKCALLIWHTLKSAVKGDVLACTE